MIVPHFLKWVNTAKAGERAAAAGALARAYVQHELPFEDRCAAEAALTLLLDDPSARVRGAMAEALALSRHAPPQVISALAWDQPEVAGVVLARSPLLTDSDLMERMAAGPLATQMLIADRPSVSIELAAAIAEVGAAEACLVLVKNDGAEIAPLSFRRMAERFGDVARLRAVLAADPRLPADCRHLLVVELGLALKGCPLVAGSMGASRADRLLRDACTKASLELADRTVAADFPVLAEHLRERGELTASFIIRAVAHGKVDFFGAILAVLTGQGEARVRALLASGGEMALRAAFRRAGLVEAVHPLLMRALTMWREVRRGKRLAGAQEVARAMLDEIGGLQATGDLATLLKAIHLEALRENAREHALAIAAA